MPLPTITNFIFFIWNLREQQSGLARQVPVVVRCTESGSRAVAFLRENHAPCAQAPSCVHESTNPMSFDVEIGHFSLKGPREANEDFAASVRPAPHDEARGL